MKLKKTAVFLIMVMMFSLTACRRQNQGSNSVLSNTNQDKASNDEEQKGQPPENQETERSKSGENGETTDNKTGENAGIFDEKADFEGSVYEFSDTGFLLSPAEVKESGEGVVMSQSAPGAEDKSKLVTITYEKDCVFKIVVMDAMTLKEVSREDTTLESIKKQTQVMVYGKCQDTTHWMAEKIVIIRWQG